MQALTGLDASFLYLENPTTHMHVGAVSVFEGSLEYTTFRRILAERIHLLPRLRQRLLQVPLSIDYPYWVDDPDFNLDLHLQHIALPKPGNWRELRRTASRVFSEPLDRSRPLWQLVFVEGLDAVPQVPPGSVALISKVHHSAVDGVSGADMMGVLFDISPDPKPLDKEPEPFEPEPIPNEIEMTARSALSFAKKPFKLPKLVGEIAAATVKAGVLTRVKSIDTPSVPFTAPKTRLNGQISAQRTWNTALLELDRVKQIKNRVSTTVNDVVLAICAGALRRYLDEKGELPAKPLVAMVPVSTRNDKQASDRGNRISNMFVQLGTHIEDPVDRLIQIQRNAMSGKAYQNAIGADMLADVTEFVPFGLANQATRMYSRLNLSEYHAPVYNVAITNVPGPQFNLFLGGHKLLANLGMAPIVDGLGLIITVFSYNGILSISPTSDMKTMPDIDEFTRYIRESANELEAAVFERFPEPDEEDEQVQDEPLSTRFFEAVRDRLVEKPELAQAGQGIFRFEITGDSPRSWLVDLENEPGKVTLLKAGASDSADATFTIKDSHFVRVLKGELDMQIAFMQGKLKVDGNIGKALKLGSLIQEIPPLDFS